jgi:hypothetical protein
VHVETIAGLLQLSTRAMATAGLQARCDRDGDIYAAQRLQDASQRLRMLAATVGSVQGLLRTLAGDGDDLDATTELGPLLGRPHAFSYRQQPPPGEPC